MRQARKHGGAASLGKSLECVWGYMRLYLFLIVLCPVIPQCSVYKCPVHTSPEVFFLLLFIIFIFVARHLNWLYFASFSFLVASLTAFTS